MTEGINAGPSTIYSPVLDFAPSSLFPSLESAWRRTSGEGGAGLFKHITTEDVHVHAHTDSCSHERACVAYTRELRTT